jgi:hypothetical protein
MSIKTFNELSVGDTFTLNGVEYKKINEVKISCCKSINAASTANENMKIKVTPITEVEIND